MSLNDTLVFVAMAFEAAVIGLLLYRRAWRTLPFFCLYSVWTLLSDGGNQIIYHRYASSYLTTYFIDQIVDFTLQFCVLVEVAWSVIRPFRASLPRYTILILASLIAAAGAIIWSFADSAALAHVPFEWHMLLRLRQTDTILRIVFFLILASCSQLLSIGWRDRELQVATGLGFYSLAALTVTVLQSHQGFGVHYRQLDQFLVVTYVCSLLYWVVSFAQKEAERRQFTPQMQSLLLAVAGSARSSRIALSESRTGKPGNHGN
ncbi:MAG TPA: hypothetical protein VHX20_10490 [Terracidiphilus sp.]|nr:hypothetical protein [Terracidiphilus sp.]